MIGGRVLLDVARDHFETFRLVAARAHDRDGLPRFIEEEASRRLSLTTTVAPDLIISPIPPL